MRIYLTASVAALFLVSGCSGFRDAKINPLNWFAKAQADAQPVLVLDAPADNRLLVDQVLTLKVEQMATGAIVRATGLPPTQGWWDAQLVALPTEEPGILVLEFRVFPPVGQAQIVNQTSREITAAYAITAFKLEAVTKIIVQGASNALSSGR
jgi:hypothetical protein